MKNYDAIIIGVGQAGKPLASFLSDKGLSVAVIEKSLVGGSCINYGCTPTKMMIASARAAFDARHASELGIDVKTVNVDFHKIIKRRDEVVRSWREGILKSLKEDEHIDFIHGKASFIDKNRVNVQVQNDESILIFSDLIFLNTGTIPRIPEIEGIDGVPCHTAKSMMELDKIPEHLMIIGGGYIGLEFGQMFRRFGSEVSILQDYDQLLPREDRDIAEAIREILLSEGINIITGAEVSKVSGDAGAIKLEYKQSGRIAGFSGTHLLVAAGTNPNTTELILANAGIKTDDHGYIKTNEKLETTAKGIYAVGDVKGGPEFTHISYDDFRILRDNLFSSGKRTISDRRIPYTLFTDPQLGRIGLNEKMAGKNNTAYKLAKMDMKYVSRGIETNNTIGMMKVLTDPASGQILGASMLMPEGGEIMTALQLAMMGELDYRRLMNSPFAHPTYAESFNNLFMNLK